jgi:hypothetical protein
MAVLDALAVTPFLQVLVNNEPVMTAIGSTTAKSGSARLVVVPRHSAVRCS